MSDDDARRAEEQHLLEAARILLGDCAGVLHQLSATVDGIDSLGGAVYQDTDGLPRCRFGCSYGRRSPRHIVDGPQHAPGCPAVAAKPLAARVDAFGLCLDDVLLRDLPPLTADEVGALVGPLWPGHDVPHVPQLGAHEQNMRRLWYALAQAREENRELRRRFGLPSDDELNKGPKEP